jgi:hypothetical protein
LSKLCSALRLLLGVNAMLPTFGVLNLDAQSREMPLSLCRKRNSPKDFAVLVFILGKTQQAKLLKLDNTGINLVSLET